jgi:hypothetical protein
MRHKIGILGFFSVLVLFAGTARADDAGLRGSIVSLELNTNSADTYLQYHGRMVVKNSDGVLDEYRWGGASCGARTLTESQFLALQAAANKKSMFIDPRYQLGQADIKCVVGFNLIEKKNLKLFP